MKLHCTTCNKYLRISHIVYGENDVRSYFCGRCEEKRLKRERGVAKARREHFERRQAHQFRKKVA